MFSIIHKDLSIPLCSCWIKSRIPLGVYLFVQDVQDLSLKITYR